MQQDVGCVQRGPLEIDVSETWAKHQQFHATWEARLAEEVTDMTAAAPSLILVDTPYLALSAGKRAGVPTVLLASFTWSEILRSLDHASEHGPLLRSIELAYREADRALRMIPGLPLSGVRNVQNIGPITEPAQSQRERLHSFLKIRDTEQLVLVGFGGIPLESLPWKEMDHMTGYQFLVDGPSPGDSSRVHSLAAVPFTFKAALASVDVVMTKPGYGTIVEAVALGLPVVYVRRYNFAEEAPLVDFLHEQGQGRELSLQDFLSGHWRPALEALAGRISARRPKPMTGAADAASSLLQYFQ